MWGPSLSRASSRLGSLSLLPWSRADWEDRVLAGAFIVSAAVHAALFWGGWPSPRASSDAVELDLTQAAPAPPSAAPRRRLAPQARPKAKLAARPEPRKEWNASARPALTPATTAQAEPSPRSGDSADPEAEVFAGSSIGAPRLLNGRELAAMLRRFYPEREREAGVEGKVMLELHLSPEGRVLRAEAVGSGGADFDDAARRIALLLRFSPTVVGGRQVAVRLRQAIRFQIAQ